MHEGLHAFSPSVVRYILHEIPPYLGLVILHTNAEGELVNWFGPVENYFHKEPVQGMDIDDFTGIFVGMLPPLISPMVIPHVKVNDHVYTELHLMSDENDDNWIFVLDQTRQVELIHPILQYYNEEKLNRSADGYQSSAKGTLSALYLLDYMSFEKTHDGYRLLGLTPEWFSNIKAKLKFRENTVELHETFPYLDVFHFEVEELWNSEPDGKMVSGIWEEDDKRGGKIYLQALALRHEKRNYLLIKPLNRESDLNDGFLQKAREQKLTLDQLAITEKKLKQLLGFKDQFVSIISHDLRSPIGAVIGLTDLLVSDHQLKDKLSPSQFELLADIRNEMLRLLDYNDKLFQWSNLELGNFKIVKTNIAATGLAAYVEKMQSTKLKQKSIDFSVQVEAGFFIKGDETLLGQALNNLVGNSVKFTPEKGKIDLLFRHNDGKQEIVVVDSGIGMDKETSERLFTSFTRKTTLGTYGEKGTGLGLGIVKKIIDAHGFTINVDSQPNQGSRFIIEIPAEN